MPIPPSLIKKLRRIVGRKQVETGPAELLVYESDGLRLHTARPGCVVYPASTDEVSQLVKVCCQAGVPFVARGAGTGLSGGAICDGGVIIQLSRMNRVLAVHPDDRYAVVQPGVTNEYLNLQTRGHGLEFAPDPSSGVSCTIGGNVAEDAGGPHTLKYGVTHNHVLGQTVVFPDGETATLGGPFPVSTGPSFSTFLIGTEGTIAITTEIIVRLVPVAPAVVTMLAIYSKVADATDAVSGILTAGVLPAALEMIDHLCIQAVEAHLKAGFPTDAAAVLIIELDGEETLMKREAEIVARVCRGQGTAAFYTAETDEERLRLWQGRKHAAGALGKITQAFYTNDGVVPRSRLTDIFQAIYRIGDKYGLRIGNMCHAGDGVIHPQILFDSDDPQGPGRAMDCSRDILLACLEMGGSITGEHGVGVEKRGYIDQMYSAVDLAHMIRLRDGFNPGGCLNPGKIFPNNAKDGETGSAASIPPGAGE
ncbi:MAG: FAD-binding protein [Fidelibacterota bacterium]|nr:MAG: FAD-binding protein [Candidatus Neomarinimicrobiota bacterium]